ncbi:Methyltransferase 6 [Chlorella sorokiniana]|uniref:Methyltransferase 6 n=1 Tax=Chlorella sorokiniana TaxID=3076 RepID=A0A2P6TVG7_CHLSO|nr:Methyltransferase 6 [Chlorella sorokiniana]|eukprot:PRW58059.1 Methyltransferase 6 [Chlorella sorokiniana]
MDLCKPATVPRSQAAKYEQQGARYWDLFYKRNFTNFFKDRHWLAREFPALLDAAAVLEVGCGVGNTTFPLLEVNPSAQVYACDYAPTAVQLVKAHPDYAASSRVHAFVADITADDLTAQVPAGSIDACTMIFVLSAIAPRLQRRAIRRVAATLRPGGRLLFRDYAAGDLCQERLAGEGRQQQLGDNFFVRWDGTCAYYFTEERVRAVFEAEGFVCEYIGAANKLLENRKKGEQMDRRFVQAVFTYTGQPSAAADEEDEDKAEEQGTAQQHQQQQQQQHGSPQAPQCHQQGAAQQPQDQDPLSDVQLNLGSTPLQLWCRQPARGSDTAAAVEAAAGARAATEALAALVLACPAFFHNTHVLELCSWDAPLASLAALRWCRRAVAAGASEAAVALLRRNAQRNGHLFVIERLRLQQLTWQQQPENQQQQGEQEQQQRRQGEQERQQQERQLLRAFPDGFHAALAAVPPTNGELQGLLGSARVQLSRQPGALLLLCASDAAAVQQAVAAAAGHGLQQAGCLPAEVTSAVHAVAESSGTQFLVLQHCI